MAKPKAKNDSRKNGGDGQIPAPLPRLAVLIDAENVSASLWPRIERLLPRLGDVAVARAYTCGTPGRWGEVSGIELIDMGHLARGPNAADFLLSFDAGRLQCEKAADEFVVVSGDDGFAALVKALRDSGTPTHVIFPGRPGASGHRLAQTADVTFLVSPPEPLPSDVPDARWLVDALSSIKADEDGWVPLTSFGVLLGQRGVTAFKGRLFEAMAELDAFEVSGHRSAAKIRIRPAGTKAASRPAA